MHRRRRTCFNMERCGCGCGWMHCAPHHPIMFISKNIMSQTFNCFLLHVREWKFNKTPKKLLTLLWYYYYYSPRREKGSECTQRLLTQFFFFFFFTSGATNLFCLCEELHTPSSLSSTASTLPLHMWGRKRLVAVPSVLHLSLISIYDVQRRLEKVCCSELAD